MKEKTKKVRKVTYRNLRDMIQKRVGNATPYSWGRAIYQYTDCGPWTSFIVGESPEQTEEYCAHIVEGDSFLAVSGVDLPPEVISFLGFNPDQNVPKSPDKDGFHSLDGYEQLIIDFIASSEASDAKRSFLITNFSRKNDSITVHLVKSVEKKNRDIYYEHEEARSDTWWKEWGKKCTGIEIGSIVEGSDVTVGPHTLMFPFTDVDLDECIDYINKEASFYWERDNCRWFLLYHNNEVCCGLKLGGGDVEWDVETGIPSDIKEQCEKAIYDDDGCLGDRNRRDVYSCRAGEWRLIEYLNDSYFF